MAWVWFGAVFVLGVITLGVIRLRFGPRHVRKKLAFPVAVAERTLADALQDLADRGASSEDFRVLRVRDDGFLHDESGEVLVNPFDPLMERLARVSVADLASLGRDAAREHETLVEAVRTWNAAAGRIAPVEALLPTVLAGYHAARQLGGRLGTEADDARSAAEHRMIFGLVGEPNPRDLPQ
jgi:hypothetical protein